MPDNKPAGATALVTGASLGFGRGIAALSRAGAQVVGVARDRSPLEELSAELGGSCTAVSADAADLTVTGQLTDPYRPAILVLNAGASRCRGRSSTRPGRRSAATGTPTLRTCSTGPAKRYSPRLLRAAS